MNALVEKVAIAIWNGPDGACEYCQTELPLSHDCCNYNRARSALAEVLDAIAEPSKSMIAEAVEAWPNLDDSTDELLWGGVYRAMIAALKRDLGSS